MASYFCSPLPLMQHALRLYTESRPAFQDIPKTAVHSQSVIAGKPLKNKDHVLNNTTEYHHLASSSIQPHLASVSWIQVLCGNPCPFWFVRKQGSNVPLERSWRGLSSGFELRPTRTRTNAVINDSIIKTDVKLINIIYIYINIYTYIIITYMFIYITMAIVIV